MDISSKGKWMLLPREGNRAYMPIATKVLSWSVWVEQDLGVIRLLKRCGRKHNLDTGANRAVLSSGGSQTPARTASRGNVRCPEQESMSMFPEEFYRSSEVSGQARAVSKSLEGESGRICVFVSGSTADCFREDGQAVPVSQSQRLSKAVPAPPARSLPAGWWAHAGQFPTSGFLEH